jgi:hypothetical protein
MLYKRIHESPLPGCSSHVIHDGNYTIGEMWFGQFEGMHRMRLFLSNTPAHAEKEASQSLVAQIHAAGGGISGFLAVWDSLPRDNRRTDWHQRAAFDSYKPIFQE